MDNFIIVFCEGDHDIAFLSRILLVDGYKPYEKKVKDFDIALKDFYIEVLQNKSIEDVEFRFQKVNGKLPYAVFYKNKSLVIFHNLGGDGNILNGKTTKITNSYLTMNDEIVRRSKGYDKLKFRFLYFLDSDNIGVDNRLLELQELLDTKDFLGECNVVVKDEYEVGCCIFYDTTNKKKYGKLEDILLELMQTGNVDIFLNSHKYIEKNYHHNSERQRRFICTQTEEKRKGSIQFKKEKAIISIAGQLQFSGASNSVIIANSDYINKDNILSSSICTQITKLFK